MNEQTKETPKHPRPRQRRWLRWIAWTLCGVLGLVLALFLFIQTGPGKKTLAWAAEKGVAAVPGLSARVVGVGGFLPFSLSVEGLTLSDETGVWLAVKDFRFAWSPAALMRGRVELTEVSADTIRLLRAPVLPPTAEEPKSAPLVWPPVFPDLPPLLLDKLAVSRIILDKEAAGQRAVLALDGRLSEESGAVALTLRVARLDGPKAFLDVSGALNYQDWTLLARVAAQEAPGGLLGSALDPGAAGPLRLDLAGRGSLADWKGRLGATLSGAPLLTSEIALSVPFTTDARVRASVSGDVRPPKNLLPAEAAGLLEDGIAFQVGGGMVMGKDALYLDALKIQAGPAALSASGFTDPDEETMDFELGLDAPDLSKFSALAGQPLSGGVSMKAVLSGGLYRPDGKITLAGSNIRTAEAGIRNLALQFGLTLPGDLGGEFPGLSLKGGGTLSGVETADGPLPVGDAAKIGLDASLDPEFALTLASLSLAAGDVSLDLGGKVDSKGPLDLTCLIDIPRLAGLAGKAGLPLSGALALQAAVTGDLAQKAFTLNVSGGLKGLAAKGTKESGEAVKNAALIVDMLGASPALSGHAALKGDALDLRELSFKGSGFSLAASGKADLAAGAQSFAAKIDLPELAALSGAAGRPLTGAAVITATTKGALESPDVAVELSSKRLKAGELELTQILVRANAADVAKNPGGDVSLGAAMGGEKLGLAASFAMNGRELALRDLKLTAPGTALSGDLSLNLDSGLVAGRIRGGAKDLASLSALAGTPLSGAFDLDATLAASKGGQDVKAAVSAKNIGAVGSAVAGLTLKADMRDALRAPRGLLSLEGQGAAAGGATLTKISFKVDGDGKGAGFTLAAKGALASVGPLSLDISGRAAPQDGGARIDLARFKAALADLPVNLEKKAVIAFGAKGAQVDGLSFLIGASRLSASGGFGPGKADFTARLADLSLSTLALVGAGPPEGLKGACSAEIRLTGSDARPSLAVTAKAQGIGLAGKAYQDMPVLSVALAASVADGQAGGTVDVSGVGARPVSLKASLPARFSLAPFVFDLPPDGALAASLAADTELKELSGLLAAFDTRMTGRFTANFTVSGTLAEPVAGGKAVLSGGTFQNAAAGTSLKNMELDLEAQGERIRLVNFSASDLKKGALKVSGEVDLAPEELFTVDASIALHKIILVDMDLAKATADGAIKISGKGTRLAVTGDVFLGPVAVNIPSSLPTDVPQMEVVEINNPNAATGAADESRQPPAAARDVTLDMKVALGEGVYVRGMGLESEWEGKLAITGTAAAPSIQGKIETLQGGGIEFFGRRLALTKGLITFTGAAPPNPLLDIKTSVAAADATCGIAVSGDAASPKIGLTSDPSMPNDEILSRILFGQSAGRITTFQALQLAQASASLLTGGGDSLDVLSRTRRLAGLDELDFVPGEKGLSDTKLRAGKYLTKGVKVSVDQGMNADSGAVSVEVDLTPNISLESRVGADSKQGVGVNWKWDY